MTSINVGCFCSYVCFQCDDSQDDVLVAGDLALKKME